MWDMAATVFGVGRSPVAPGTVASLVSLPVAWLVMMYGGPFVLLALAAAVFIFGLWASENYAVQAGNADPSECVIDEVAGQFIACAMAPLSIPGFAVAFVLFRLFDVSKLWPISWAERMPGGLGIMSDDLLAGVFAGAIVAVFAGVGLL
ncbi:MAG TPA: phosphatidylglycerophosphatase A [Rhizomicrobium sp.]|nr:phosphatidylglycerophosphatase A [Rhizomicrobium sp.]